MKKSKGKESVHEPVLVNEVLDAFGLNIAPLKSQASPAVNIHSFGEHCRIIDATVGAAGHSKEFVKRGVEVLGIDQDLEMLKFAEEVLKQACPTPNQNGLGSFKLLHGNFKDVDKIALGNAFTNVDGVLIDLGVSSYHFDSKERGFSFSNPKAPLDMRLDPDTQGVTAADLLNSLPKDKLFQLFEPVLPYKEAKALSARIIVKRLEGKIETVGDFSDLIKPNASAKVIDASTLPFMALRMAVNSELENLSEALPKAFNLLKSSGRMVIISFHSGEDRVAKSIFKQLEDAGKAKIVTKKPVTPGKKEREINPRSRSAKMRVLQKI